MDLKTELRKAVMVCLCFLVIFSSASTVFGANTDTYITVEASKVTNLYYEITQNGTPVDEEIRFVVKDAVTGEIVAEGVTEDGILFIPNVPFGKYILEAENGKQFSLSLDTAYLKEAHILKTLDISISGEESVIPNEKEASDGAAMDKEQGIKNPAPTTGDDTLLLPAVAWMIAAVGTGMYLTRKRKDNCEV